MFRIINLQEIIKSENNEAVFFKMNEFSSLNEDVEYFIKYKAVEFEKRNFCRTFLVFDDDANLIAYYTLALKTLFFNADLSKNKRKQIQGFTADVSSVPVVLIGQLSKNNTFSNKITGTELLDLCLNTVYKVHNLIGGRVCLAETDTDENNTKVVDFYKQNGFYTLQQNEDKRFYQMVKKLN